MRRLSILVLVPLALLAAACGGGGSKGGDKVSGDDVAVVGGRHIARSELDRRMVQAKCSADAQKQTFPKAGSPEYIAVQQQFVGQFVQQAEFEQKAPGLGVKVTDAQVETQLKQIKKQYFGGSEQRYQAEIKKQCITDPEVRSELRSSLLAQAISKKVTAGAKVTDGEVKAYYDSHTSTYTQPQTRVVRHILVKTKKQADQLYNELKGGADFATLAKKFSQDPGSKSQGGELTISRGQTVPEFDKVAFELKTGETSKPVKTQYGWHIIRAEKEATKSKTTPFKQVKEAIRQQLLQQKRNSALQTWLDGVKKEFVGKVSYATGLAPPATTTTATTTG